MVEFSQLILLIFAVLFSFSFNNSKQTQLVNWANRIVKKSYLAQGIIIFVVFIGCLAIVGVLHEPVPRIHDEFSYLLMAETFASGHVINPAPSLPQFFDTFHELMHPVYVSKYFPAQGVFLAIGQVTGHPIVGVWLSSVLACAAAFWMLEGWISSTWALLGAVLMVLQLGIYSYWSQSYWGGMVAALGGALFFGAIRRLWEKLDWRNGIWLALGLVIMANSRPLEGTLVSLPITFLFFVHVGTNHRWREARLWTTLTPVATILVLGAIGIGAYNRAITGSALKTPYMMHEQQYQESPPFIFMSPRPAVKYSSFWLWEYYHIKETQQYTGQRSPALWLIAIARKLRSWWFFYCGILLTPSLILPGLLRPGGIRYVQIILLVALTILGISIGNPPSVPSYALVDALVVIQAGVLWLVFDDFWSRAALSTIYLLLFEIFFNKWFFPHYFAPAACLVLFLQIKGLRKVWDIACRQNVTQVPVKRSERRRIERELAKRPMAMSPWRTFVILLPVCCFISLALRVATRVNGWTEDIHEPEWGALPLQDWSTRRAELEHWLEQQPNPQLVFVRYPLRHRVDFEWVFNHADLIHAHVIWARDLGTKNDGLLLEQFPDRIAWMVDGDAPEPQLVPYSQVGISSGFTPGRPINKPAESQPNW